MPLYLEILDHDRSTVESALPTGPDVTIRGSWTSASTGTSVLLFDAPERPTSPPAARLTRILFY